MKDNCSSLNFKILFVCPLVKTKKDSIEGKVFMILTGVDFVYKLFLSKKAKELQECSSRCDGTPNGLFF